MNVFQAYFNQKLEDRESNGLLRKLRNYSGLVDLSSNDFLGIATAQNSGATGSRLISGNFSELENIEEFFAKKLEAPSALYYNSGYMANIGTINALLTTGDAVFEDQLNHASLLDAGWLSRADFQRYAHGDTESLEQKLLASSAQQKLIVTDGVFTFF